MSEINFQFKLKWKFTSSSDLISQWTSKRVMFNTVATYNAAVDYKIINQLINERNFRHKFRADQNLEICLLSMRNQYSETPYDGGGPPILTRAASRYCSPYYCTP
jgi:hypothetical protein